MPILEERVAFLEGRVGEHAQMLKGIRESMFSLEQGVHQAIAHLEERMDRRFELVDRRFLGLEQRVTALDQKLDHWMVRVDQRFEAIDQKFAGLDDKFAGLDQKFVNLDQKFDQKLDQKITGLDQKLARHFMWLVGMQVTALVAIVATLLKR